MNKKRKITLIVMLIIIVTILLFSLVSCQRQNNRGGTGEESTHINKTISFDQNQTDKKENINKKLQPDIVLPGWGDLMVEAETTEIRDSINLYNPEKNVYFNCPMCGGLLDDLHCIYCEKNIEFEEAIQNAYYLRFKIFLKDNNEQIYESGLVKPGFRIENIVLNHALEIGDYEASILIEPYKSDMTTKCNCGKVDVVLHAIASS